MLRNGGIPPPFLGGRVHRARGQTAKPLYVWKTGRWKAALLSLHGRWGVTVGRSIVTRDHSPCMLCAGPLGQTQGEDEMGHHDLKLFKLSIDVWGGRALGMRPSLVTDACCSAALSLCPHAP